MAKALNINEIKMKKKLEIELAKGYSSSMKEKQSLDDNGRARQLSCQDQIGKNFPVSILNKSNDYVKYIKH